MYGLRSLGYQAEIRENEVFPGETNIVFGAHMLPVGFPLPATSIIYNWEQIGSYQAPEGYYDLAEQYTVWDYSQRNVEKWKELGYDVRHVPLGYVPELTRIQPAKEQDIPVLFYGCMNDRRMDLLNALLDAGVKYEWESPCFGARRDALIARAKIVLNMHFYDAKIFEISRVGYLLSNSKAVLSEASEGMDPNLKGAVFEADYERLVDSCQYLLHNNSEREGLAIRGFELFFHIREADILREVLR